jgi:DnaJ-class molecular chaperone
MTDTKVTCPSCKGDGKMEVTYMDLQASKRQKRIVLDKNSTTIINCSWCYGTGVVSENTAKLIIQTGYEKK